MLTGWADSCKEIISAPYYDLRNGYCERTKAASSEIDSRCLCSSNTTWEPGERSYPPVRYQTATEKFLFAWRFFMPSCIQTFSLRPRNPRRGLSMTYYLWELSRNMVENGICKWRTKWRGKWRGKWREKRRDCGGKSERQILGGRGGKSGRERMEGKVEGKVKGKVEEELETKVGVHGRWT